ncbi:MAG: hypothetical protein R3B53_04735 [Candidatus Paceibacterota bacterium]
MITAPEFGQATINLQTVRYLTSDSVQKRYRAIVSGTITDDSGERKISGSVQIIK